MSQKVTWRVTAYSFNIPNHLLREDFEDPEEAERRYSQIRSDLLTNPGDRVVLYRIKVGELKQKPVASLNVGGKVINTWILAIGKGELSKSLESQVLQTIVLLESEHS